MTSIFRDPLPNFTRLVSSADVPPLGNVTSLLLHIDKLFSYVNTNSQWSYSKGNSVGTALKYIFSAYHRLLSIVNQQELIPPLLKIVSPTVAKMLDDKFIKAMVKHLPNLVEEVENVFVATTTVLQARYIGSYTKEFLGDVEDFLVASLEFNKKAVKSKANEMWQVRTIG